MISAMPLRQSLACFLVNLLSWVLSVAGPILIYREAEP